MAYSFLVPGPQTILVSRLLGSFLSKSAVKIPISCNTPWIMGEFTHGLHTSTGNSHALSLPLGLRRGFAQAICRINSVLLCWQSSSRANLDVRGGAHPGTGLATSSLGTSRLHYDNVSFSDIRGFRPPAHLASIQGTRRVSHPETRRGPRSSPWWTFDCILYVCTMGWGDYGRNGGGKGYGKSGKPSSSSGSSAQPFWIHDVLSETKRLNAKFLAKVTKQTSNALKRVLTGKSTN